MQTQQRPPLLGLTVHAVVIGQAWHWMEPRAAGVEIVRVLRPGGHVGLVWNVRDTRHAWVADLDRLTSDRDEAARTCAVTGPVTPDVPTSFGTARDHTVGNPQTLSRAGLVDLVATTSWVAMHPERDDVIKKVAALIERVAGPGSTVTLPQVCRCFRCQIG